MSLAVSAPPRSAPFPSVPTFDGPRQTKKTETGRGDMIGFYVFTALIVLGLLAAARALLLM